MVSVENPVVVSRGESWSLGSFSHPLCVHVELAWLCVDYTLNEELDSHTSLDYTPFVPAITSTAPDFIALLVHTWCGMFIAALLLSWCSLARSSWTSPFGRCACALQVRGRGISTGEYRRGNSPPWAVALERLFKFSGHQPQNW